MISRVIELVEPKILANVNDQCDFVRVNRLWTRILISTTGDKISQHSIHALKLYFVSHISDDQPREKKKTDLDKRLNEVYHKIQPEIVWARFQNVIFHLTA